MHGHAITGTMIRRARFTPRDKKEGEQDETRNPYQPPCFYALFYIYPQPRDRRSPSLIGLRALLRWAIKF
jgi:hypothetical protein